MITKEEAFKLMKELADKWDPEMGHRQGDDILIEIINDHLPEFKDITDIFKKMRKWYS